MQPGRIGAQGDDHAALDFHGALFGNCHAARVFAFGLRLLGFPGGSSRVSL